MPVNQKAVFHLGGGGRLAFTRLRQTACRQAPPPAVRQQEHGGPRQTPCLPFQHAALRASPQVALLPENHLRGEGRAGGRGGIEAQNGATPAVVAEAKTDVRTRMGAFKRGGE